MLKYSAVYFNKTKKIIEKHKPDNIVVLQFFQRQDDMMLGGIDEVLEILKKETDTSKYIIRSQQNSYKMKAFEVVLELEGPYQYFGEYEGIIDGILARGTSIASNAYHLSKLTNKKLVFMGDRADLYINQEFDGKYVAIGGITTQVTKAHGKHHNGNIIGTMPHALIQMFDGNLIKALHAYKDTIKEEKLTALVDFNNDVINDSIDALKEFGKDLGAVRVDTAGNMSDSFFKNDEEYGVTPNLIKELRKQLDNNNGTHIKIIVSSGFNKDKIKLFEKENTPVDIYGVGGSLLNISPLFTADAVRINGKDIAKSGRCYRKHNLPVIKLNK